MTDFQQFSIDELFDIKTTKWYQISKDKLISRHGTTPVISNGAVDNGVLGLSNYVPNNNANVITYSDTTTGANTFFYQPKSFIGYSHIKQLIPKKFVLTQEIAHYIIAAIRTAIYGQYDWGVKLNDQSLKPTQIELPTNSEKNIDWQYMSNYVKRIEANYVKRIEAYLKILGYPTIDSTKLNDADYGILSQHQEAKFGKFKICELFDVIKRGRRIKSADRIKGDLPFITAGTTQTGFSSYIGNEDAERFPANSLTIDMFGTTYYRGYVFGADDHITVLHETGNKFNRNVLQYIQPNIEKAIFGQFSYAKNFYASDAAKVEISLPVKDGQLDVDLMNSYIGVMQKKTVSQLRRHLDNKRKALKTIVG